MTAARRRRRRRNEDGFAGGAEGLVFGLLIFVVGTLMVGNAWAVVDTKLAADAASREAVRSYVEAAGAASAEAGATQAADATLAGYGRPPGRSSISFAGAAFGRCERVTVTVAYQAPLVELPLIGTPGQGETVRAAHSEVVDPYRAGLAGAAACG